MQQPSSEDIKELVISEIYYRGGCNVAYANPGPSLDTNPQILMVEDRGFVSANLRDLTGLGSSIGKANLHPVDPGWRWLY